MSELGKPFLKNQFRKIKTKNRKSMSKYRLREQNPLARNVKLILTKKTRTRMNYEWIGKTTKNKI